MRTLILSCSLGVLLCATCSGQNPEPSPSSPPQTAAAQSLRPGTLPRDAAKQERIRYEAKELAALTKTIPNDISAANRGLLPKDAVDKLKRIEKLTGRQSY